MLAAGQSIAQGVDWWVRAPSGVPGLGSYRQGGGGMGLILPEISISDFLMGKLRHGACGAGRGGEARMLSTMGARAAPSHHLPAHR